MESSGYQSFKSLILEVLPLSKDAIHIHMGLMVLFLAVFIWRRGRLDYLSLLPVFMAAGAMEFLDLRDDLLLLGYMRWFASVHDLINTVFWPTIIVIAYKWVETRKTYNLPFKRD
ncbi:hypothetical protein X474_27545 [Dethiosulfatarculus sandiegensis]|uniref:VanZ-like domain-containing protein n=2 Tax=Dethiosulfatarculus sandiegensis TaxID=1429043 RepID=A0A0D2J5I7_9BACT|nr:hypothetical protein X474_27545 [Dethiosulfatarculus sandiegensis]